MAADDPPTREPQYFEDPIFIHQGQLFSLLKVDQRKKLKNDTPYCTGCFIFILTEYIFSRPSVKPLCNECQFFHIRG